MLLTSLRTIGLLLCLTVSTGLAFQSSPANRPWPQGVQKVLNESPVLSPADAVKTFFMPPGYHVELVASERYRNTNESALHVDFVPTPYFMRNPTLLRTRGSYDSLEDDNNDLNTVWPVRPNPGTNRAYQAGIDRPDGTLAKFTAVCAPMVYRGDRLPSELYGNVFVADPAANFVSRIVLSDDGTTLRAKKAYENAEFLASTDERFRPVYISNAPDGALYIVDFYRGIIQDRASTTLYLRDHIIARKLDQPTRLGRIYRVVHESTRLDSTAPFANATPSQLVEALSHPNGGAATRRSACWLNAMPDPSHRRS
jgi:hypothetical protein